MYCSIKYNEFFLVTEWSSKASNELVLIDCSNCKISLVTGWSESLFDFGSVSSALLLLGLFSE